MAAIGLVGAVSVCQYASVNLTSIDRVARQTYLWGFVAIALAASGLFRSANRHWLKFLTIAAAMILAGCWTLMGLVLPAQRWPVYDIAAPRGHPFQLVVEDVGFWDEEYVLSIRQTTPIVGLTYQVGCLTDYVDDPDSYRWAADGSSFSVRFGASTLVIPVDAESGRPSPVRDSMLRPPPSPIHGCWPPSPRN